MDTTKAPGIVFKEIILKELSFVRGANYPDTPEFQINFQQHNNFSPERDKLQLELKCVVSDKKKSFEVSAAMLSFFEVEKGKENMSLEKFAELNGPALVLPYLREVVMNTTTRAGLPPVLIPPINLNTVMRSTVETNLGETEEV